MFYLSDENVELLKSEKNRSFLINELLKGYFKNKIPQTIEEMEKEAKKLEAELEYMDKIEKIENGK